VDVVKLANRGNAEGVRVVARHVLSLEGHPSQVRPRLQRSATAVASHCASSCSPTPGFDHQKPHELAIEKREGRLRPSSRTVPPGPRASPLNPRPYSLTIASHRSRPTRIPAIRNPRRRLTPRGLASRLHPRFRPR